MNYRSDIDDELILQEHDEGKSFRELGRQYKCSPNTIRSRYKKAYQEQLNRDMEDDEDDEDDVFIDVYNNKTDNHDLWSYYDTFMETAH